MVLTIGHTRRWSSPLDIPGDGPGTIGHTRGWPSPLDIPGDLIYVLIVAYKMHYLHHGMCKLGQYCMEVWPSDLSFVQTKKVKTGHLKDETWENNKNVFQEFQNKKTTHSSRSVSITFMYVVAFNFCFIFCRNHHSIFVIIISTFIAISSERCHLEIALFENACGNDISSINRKQFNLIFCEDYFIFLLSV